MSAKQTPAEKARWAAAHAKARRALDAMTDEEDAAITAAAMADPDCPPSTDEQLSKMRRMPLVRVLRMDQSLSQTAFAARYGIPVSRIRDWEQHRTTPDLLAAQYLELIRLDPERIAKMVARTMVPAGALSDA